MCVTNDEGFLLCCVVLCFVLTSGERGLCVSVSSEILIKAKGRVRLQESGRFGHVIPVSEARWRSRALHCARVSAAESRLLRVCSGRQRRKRRVPKRSAHSLGVLRLFQA